jgi:hypothetical protein
MFIDLFSCKESYHSFCIENQHSSSYMRVTIGQDPIPDFKLHAIPCFLFVYILLLTCKTCKILINVSDSCHVN